MKRSKITPQKYPKPRTPSSDRVLRQRTNPGQLVESVFRERSNEEKRQEDTDAEEWFNQLPQAEQDSVGEGIEAILRGGMQLAQERAVDTLAGKRQRDEGAPADKSPKKATTDRQPPVAETPWWFNDQVDEDEYEEWLQSQPPTQVAPDQLANNTQQSPNKAIADRQARIAEVDESEDDSEGEESLQAEPNQVVPDQLANNTQQSQAQPPNQVIPDQLANMTQQSPNQSILNRQIRIEKEKMERDEAVLETLVRETGLTDQRAIAKFRAYFRDYFRGQLSRMPNSVETPTGNTRTIDPPNEDNIRTIGTARASEPSNDKDSAPSNEARTEPPVAESPNDDDDFVLHDDDDCENQPPPDDITESTQGGKDNGEYALAGSVTSTRSGSRTCPVVQSADGGGGDEDSGRLAATDSVLHEDDDCEDQPPPDDIAESTNGGKDNGECATGPTRKSPERTSPVVQSAGGGEGDDSGRFAATDSVLHEDDDCEDQPPPDDIAESSNGGKDNGEYALAGSVTSTRSGSRTCPVVQSADGGGGDEDSERFVVAEQREDTNSLRTNSTADIDAMAEPRQKRHVRHKRTVMRQADKASIDTGARLVNRKTAREAGVAIPVSRKGTCLPDALVTIASAIKKDDGVPVAAPKNLEKLVRDNLCPNGEWVKLEAMVTFLPSIGLQATMVTGQESNSKVAVLTRKQGYFLVVCHLAGDNGDESRHAIAYLACNRWLVDNSPNNKVMEIEDSDVDAMTSQHGIAGKKQKKHANKIFKTRLDGATNSIIAWYEISRLPAL
eukprot:scaffold1143_cov177-Amphora_coffeaeformis.AAC.20